MDGLEKVIGGPNIALVSTHNTSASCSKDVA
jgi:hypothetical protein